jgi:hypothetical protein
MKPMYKIAVMALMASTTLTTTPALARDTDRHARPEIIRDDTREIRGDRQELRKDVRERREDRREDAKDRGEDRREDAKDRGEDRRDEANPRRVRHHRLEMACRDGNAKACRMLGDNSEGNNGEHRGEVRGERQGER